jgi:hypothetical protein
LCNREAGSLGIAHAVARPSGAATEERRAMSRSAVTSQRLVALFLLGTLLFNYPLLAVFDRTALFLGIPVLYAYVFSCWALLIGLLALVVERSG